MATHLSEAFNALPPVEPSSMTRTQILPGSLLLLVRLIPVIWAKVCAMSAGRKSQWKPNKSLVFTPPHYTDGKSVGPVKVSVMSCVKIKGFKMLQWRRVWRKHRNSLHSRVFTKCKFHLPNIDEKEMRPPWHGFVNHTRKEKRIQSSDLSFTLF